jgi:hypothetical protein
LRRAAANAFKSGITRHKFTPATVGVAGKIAGMDELEQRYMALVERVRGYPMAEAARAVILAEITAAYRRERAQAEQAINQHGSTTGP